VPTFEDSARSEAPPEEVWKLLYDPSRFPEWWAGVETVAPEQGGYTMYPEGYPDFPMPQRLETARDERSVKISCLVSDLRFEWRLEPLGDGEATAVSVYVEIPDQEAHRLDAQRDAIRRSLVRLTELAGSGAA
jgi:uncharacterized protein YndB with AHSA1/START domain